MKELPPPPFETKRCGFAMEPFALCLTLAVLLLSPLSLFASLDENGNGMSDIWERLYGAVDIELDLDPDNDGQSNYLESVAGTNPFDPDSVLEVTSINHRPSALMVSWNSSKGILYQVRSTDNLKNGTWVEEGGVRLGNGSQLAIVLDRPSTTQRFYRVEVVTDKPQFYLDALSSFSYDSDHDGQSDLNEILAGVNLFDSSSKLESPEVKIGASVEVTWKTQKGKSYQVRSKLSDGPDSWVNEGLPYVGSGDEITVGLVSPGVHQRVYTIQVNDIDTDQDGLSDWEEGVVGLDPILKKTQPLGQGDAAELGVALGQNSVVSVKASRAVANLTLMENGAAEIIREGGLDEISVSYTIGGTATPGVDYQALSGVVTIPFGAKSVLIPIIPLAGSSMELSKSVVITLVDGADYDLNQQGSQQVNIIKEVALNVKDFGATGDGVTDDTSAIQAAIDALEASTEHNTLFFPSGKYRLNTKKWTSYYTATSQWRILQLGGADLTGRDIVFVGEPNAVLYSTLSPTRVHMLLAVGRFRSLTFRGMAWEKDGVPLDEQPGRSTNGADGVSVVNFDDRKIELLKFSDCKFTNCHGAVWIYSAGYDNRGKLAEFRFENNEVLNPYGSNTENSELSWGGGLQVRVSAWVDYAHYDGNLFEGGGADMTDLATSPGGTLKDASHYGSPLRLKFTNNVVRYMGYESLFQVNDNTSMGATVSGFVVPPNDGVSTASVTMSAQNSTFSVGDIINLRAPAIPGLSSQNNIFEVVSFDVATRNLTFKNTGNPINASAGVEVTPYKAVYLNNSADPTYAVISNNLFDGSLPLGAKAKTNNYGIASHSQSQIYDNVIINWGIGIQLYEEVHTPLYPASRGSVIRNNYIRGRDTSVFTSIYSHGIQSWSIDEYIEGNKVVTPVGIRFVGITLRGQNTLAENNSIWPISKRNNGYYSSVRATGIGVGDESSGLLLRANKTYGFDLGVGQLQPRGYIPHSVSRHESFDDVVGVDPKSTIVP